MFKRIDFDKEVPYFIDGNFKWYFDEYFNNYLKNSQGKNLPSLQNFAVFIVKNDDIEDYVLIDNKQNVIDGYPYNYSGADQMIAKINIIKISKNYDEYEKSNI